MSVDLAYLLRECPGVSGDMARYVNESMESNQPGIALSTTLAFMGALKSKRVKHKIGARVLVPNIYTCTLGLSGSGKSSAQDIINEIIRSSVASANFKMGEPASDSGMLAALQKESRRFLIWDEFGMALSEMAKSSSSYRVAIIRAMTSLYSAAGKPCIGKEYADKDTVNVDKPYLSICAASTPGVFFDSLNKSFIESGFLSRWLVFQGEEKDMWQDNPPKDIPAHIIEAVNRIDIGKERKSGGNLEVVLEVEESLLTFVSPTIHDEIKTVSREKLSSAKNEYERVFWTRAFEQALKLCMIFSDDFGVVKDRDAAYAWILVEYLIQTMIDKCDVDLHDSLQDKIRSKRVKKFINIISPGQTITKTKFCKKAFDLGFRGKEREEILTDLLENKIWIESFKTNDVTNKKITYYSRVE